MNDKTLIEKICSHVKNHHEKPAKIDGYEGNYSEVERYWYGLMAKGVISIHNTSGFKITVDSDYVPTVSTKYKVDESLLYSIFEIKLE